jgi:sec-independent protein translocase protein TatA
MFGLGMPELIVIFIICLIVFGAGKLPEIGSSIGQGIRNFKKATSDEPEKLKSPKEKTKEIEDKDKEED